MTTTSKKRSKKTNFYFLVLKELENNPSQSLKRIAKTLHLSKQNLNYYSHELKDHELIESAGYGTWQITLKGKKVMERKNAQEFLLVVLDKPQRSKKNLSKVSSKGGSRGHYPLVNYQNPIFLQQFQVTIPIKEGRINLKKYGGTENKQFNNWIPQHLDVEYGINFHIRNNNNKSVTIFLNMRRIVKTEDIYVLIAHLIPLANQWFAERNITLDIQKFRVDNFDIEQEDDVVKKKMSKGSKHLVKFNKDRKKITKQDPDQDSKAWADTSPYPAFRGTNDIDYMDAYLRMPFAVRDLEHNQAITTKNIAQLSEQMTVHIPVLVQNADTMRKNQETAERNAEIMEQIAEYIGVTTARQSESQKILNTLKSIIKSTEDVLKYPDKVMRLTTDDKIELTEWINRTIGQWE